MLGAPLSLLIGAVPTGKMPFHNIPGQSGEVGAVEQIGVAPGGLSCGHITVAIADDHRRGKVDIPFFGQLEDHAGRRLAARGRRSQFRARGVRVAGAKGDIGDPPAGPFRLVAQMIVKCRHLGFAVKLFADAALV